MTLVDASKNLAELYRGTTAEQRPKPAPDLHLLIDNLSNTEIREQLLDGTGEAGAWHCWRRIAMGRA